MLDRLCWTVGSCAPVSEGEHTWGWHEGLYVASCPYTLTSDVLRFRGALRGTEGSPLPKMCWEPCWGGSSCVLSALGSGYHIPVPSIPGARRLLGVDCSSCPGLPWGSRVSCHLHSPGVTVYSGRRGGPFLCEYWRVWKYVTYSMIIHPRSWKDYYLTITK